MLQKFGNSLLAYQNRLSFIVMLFLLAYSAWVLGELVWQVRGDQVAVERWQPNLTTEPFIYQDPKQDISLLIDANIFGEYKAVTIGPDKSKPKPIAPPAPRTKLNLTLVGLVSSSNLEQGLAVIAHQGYQETYGIGEQVKGTKAKLVNVYADRVIIDNQGHNETLVLEWGKSMGGHAGNSNLPRRGAVTGYRPQDTTTAGINNGLSDSELLAVAKQEILEDPQKLLHYIRLSRVADEKGTKGYRVRPGKSRVVFDSVGLQDGDIATHINGTDLTQPAAMDSLWQVFTQATEFQLTVLRDEQRHEVYVTY